MKNKGTISKPKIKLSIYSQEKLVKDDLESIIKELNWRYGLDEDISEFCNKFKSDKFLKLPLKRLKEFLIVLPKGKINEFELRKMTTEEAKEKLMKLYGAGPLK
ncbi:MAG: hypothetical protein QXS48_00890 [Candidatus Aenigmatarchaeota archaeon]